MFAPWPRLADWIEATKADQSTVVERDSGGLWVWSTRSNEFRLTFDDDGRIHAIRSGVGSTIEHRLVFTFDRDADGNLLDIPSRLRETVVRHTNDGEEVLGDIDLEILSVDLRRSAPDRWFTFDPEALQASRYDPESGNVYDYDGEVLYNHRERERQLLAGVGGWLPGPAWVWLWTGLAAIGATGLWAHGRQTRAA